MKTVLLLAFLTPAAYAGQLNVDYSSFYNHLKKIDKTELNALQFAFGFKRVQQSTLCQINKAELVTQKVTMPVEVNADQRFILPSEKALKLANAEVVVELSEPNNQCDMSVQLETKAEYLKTRYTAAELNVLNQQYKTFFDDMGSFLSFLMPSTQGLKLVFAAPPQLSAPLEGTLIQGNTLILSDAFITAMQDSLELADKPLRITAEMRQ